MIKAWGGWSRVASRVLVPVMVLLGVQGCAVVDHTASGSAMSRQEKWALLPLVNHTETPMAGLRAEGITESLLRGRAGVGELVRYPASLSQESLFEPSERKVQDEALKWARQQGVRYAVLGSVDEWRYKVGVDGEPAVGITLQVVDVPTGKVVWSGSGGKAGWSREALSAVAQKLLRDLVSRLNLQ